MRNTIYTIFMCSLFLAAFSCQLETQSERSMSEMFEKATNIEAPTAKKVEKKLEKHGDVRVDNYYWLNERENSEVIDYLEAENSYRSEVMSHLDEFSDKLFEEIKGRINPTDMSVPYLDNGYYYFTKYEDGNEYPIYSRRKGSIDSPAEVLLDVNTLAKDYAFFSIGGRSVSPNNKVLAYAEDTLSRRLYTLRFKNLETGELYPEQIEHTSGGAVWAADNKTVFYTSKNPESLRPEKIWRHTLGEDPSNDVMIYHEEDETFIPFIYKTKTGKYLVQGSYHTLMREYRILESDNPTGEFRIFEARKRDLEYSIEHFGDKFYVVTNLDAKNFRLMECPEGKTGKEHWKEVVAHRDDVLLQGVDVFNGYLVMSERAKGITQLRVQPLTGEEHYIDFGEDAYVTYTTANYVMDTEVLRLSYQSMTTPPSTFDYNMRTGEKTLLKQQEVLGGFDSANYKSERVYAKARDGVEVPISLVYHKDTKVDGSAPCLLYGYGSYGASMEPSFSHTRLTLLDRGFVWAIAHIRGGEEMGRHWYEDGKKFKKKNTFTDFIDCGEYLIQNDYSDEDNLFALGGSAGGLLMGAVINMKPDMWKGVIAAVPFVDVVTTMLDESIPLTTGEYDEWGNPNEKDYYEYMLSYSPYDNVEAQDYPTLLITTGLHDSQVQYFEPAKWIAKLREYKTDKNPLMMYCNMETGHGGASGRYERYKETAMQYAFLLDLAEKSDPTIKG